MLPTCPLVVYFCNNQYSTQGMKVDPQAFANLLSPAGSMAGGWIGFLNGAAGCSYDDYTNLLRTHVDDPAPPTPPQCKPPDATKGILTGITAGISVAMMAIFLPESAPLWPVILGAAATGGISGYQAGVGTC